MTIWTSNGRALYSSLKSQLFAELKGYGSMTALGFFFVILNDSFSLPQILTWGKGIEISCLGPY